MHKPSRWYVTESSCKCRSVTPPSSKQVSLNNVTVRLKMPPPDANKSRRLARVINMHNEHVGFLSDGKFSFKNKSIR